MDEKMSKGMAEMVLTGKNEVLEENTCSNSTLFTTN
jgi:hypothetical protein